MLSQLELLGAEKPPKVKAHLFLSGVKCHMHEWASSVHIFNQKKKENMLLEKSEHIISIFRIGVVIRKELTGF